MKLNSLFEEIESRRQNVSDSGVITFSAGSIVQGISGNAVWNTETKKVNILSKVKFLGITIKQKVTELSVEDFFEKVKKTKSQIKIIDGIVDKYLSSIEKAEKFGQTALVEKMKDEIEIVKKEALANVNGIKEYLTQEQVEKLLKKSTKNIEIDYVKNFSRHIPDKLLALKTKLDADKVFDDYVVMHYDPKKTNTDLTKKEKARKRDPILFGVIKDSRNLYYIGDWVDEFCDLTLKEAVAIIEDKTKKLNA